MANLLSYFPKSLQSLPTFSEEEIEAARRKIAAKNALCDPDCPICWGTGYYQEPGNYGKVTPCPTFAARRTRKKFDKSGLIKSEVENLTWEKSLENINDAPQVASQVREVLERGYGWVYLWGDHGLAKTTILQIAVAVTLRNSDKAAAYTTMTNLLDNLRLAYDEKEPSKEAEERIGFWKNLPVLCLDEFEKTTETAWVKERRFSLMDHRYVQALRGESVTLMSANVPPNKLEPYLADRVSDGRMLTIQLSGVSARPMMSRPMMLWDATNED